MIHINNEIEIKNLNSNSIIINKISTNKYFISSNSLENNLIIIEKNSKMNYLLLIIRIM